MKNNYIKRNVVDFLESTLFKALLFLLIIMTLFTVLNYDGIPIIDSISMVFSDYTFLSMCVLPIFLFLTTYVYDLFVKDIFAITRFKNRKDYLKELLKNVFIVTTIIFLIMIAMVLIMENIFNFNGYKIEYNSVKHCSNLTYTIFVVMKLYLFVILFSLFNTLLIQSFKSKLVIILNFIFFTTIFYCGFQVYDVSSISKMPLYIGNYLVNNMTFHKFGIEILVNTIVYSILFIVFILLSYISKKQKRDIGS